jgi:hypothetical protein
LPRLLLCVLLSLQEIAGDVLGEQSPKRLFQVRAKLYELLVNCIPPEVRGWVGREGARVGRALLWVGRACAVDTGMGE